MFNIHQDEWRQGDYGDFRISIIEKGSEIYRCIPDIYFHKSIFYKDLLQNSFIQNPQGSLAFLIRKFGDGKRAYFSDTLENTLKEVYEKSKSYVCMKCKFTKDIHVIEEVPDSSLIADIHDNKYVSNEKLIQLKNNLNYIKEITDNNSGYIPTPLGYSSFHDTIDGVVFRFNRDINCKTIMLFKSDSLKITQLINNNNQELIEKDFNDNLYIESDCSYKYNYSTLLEK